MARTSNSGDTPATTTRGPRADSQAAEARPVEIAPTLSVRQLAETLGASAIDVIKQDAGAFAGRIESKGMQCVVLRPGESTDL